MAKEAVKKRQGGGTLLLKPSSRKKPRLNRFVQQFASRYDHYERLCIEVHSLLQAHIVVSKIPVAHIAWRVKKIDSLLDKCRVKDYPSPEKQVTDICGVRLVYLYRKDLPRIERIIKKAFNVCERVERRPTEADQFGYEALHFLVKLTRRTSGPRYELLKDMVCEVQIRTILQDSWAVLDHHLRYKSPAQIPSSMRREIHSLAAAIEAADRQFDDIEARRRGYLRKLQDPKVSLSALLKEETNRDSIAVYLKRKFPDLVLSVTEKHLDYVLEHMDTTRFARLSSIDAAIDQSASVRSRYKRDLYAKTSAAQLAIALASVDSKYRELTLLGTDAQQAIDGVRTEA